MRERFFVEFKNFLDREFKIQNFRENFVRMCARRMCVCEIDVLVFFHQKSFFCCVRESQQIRRGGKGVTSIAVVVCGWDLLLLHITHIVYTQSTKQKKT